MKANLPDGFSAENKEKNIEESEGDLENSDSKDKIMHKVLPVQKNVDIGNMISEAINRSLSSFSADLLFENITKNFKTAKELYGETILRKLSGYGTEELERNIRIPEFRKEIYERIKQSIKELKSEKVIEQNGDIAKKGIKLAKLSMLVTLENMKSKSIFGDISKEKDDVYGENHDIDVFRKGVPFRNIALKNTIKLALRRGHGTIQPDDILMHKKRSKQRSTIIYAIDASGSMSGNKIRVSKEAGLSLAYHAIENKDLAGLVVFGKEVFFSQNPTSEFDLLLDNFVNIKASGKTDFVRALSESHNLLSGYNGAKHVIIITDALPTVGDDPKAESLSEIARLKADNITVSIIGIGLNEDGINFAKEIMEKGEGKLYVVNDLNELNYIILEDYYST
jgi:Mg-chelatase subunit ChlD